MTLCIYHFVIAYIFIYNTYSLGFVVEQYWKRERFISEPFWSIQVAVEKDGLTVPFHWSRGSLFNQLCCVAIYEQLIQDPIATIQQVQSKPTSKWYNKHYIYIYIYIYIYYDS